MTEREKIIQLAKRLGISEGPIYLFDEVGLVAFYNLAQKEILEQAVNVCEKKWRKEDSFDSHANDKAIRQLIRSE